MIVIPLLVLAAALVFLVWDRSYRQATAHSPGTSCPSVVQAGPRLPLASSNLRRVALIGDSIMNQASCSVAESLAQVGVQTGRYAVDGSGLLTGPVDWVKALPLILHKEHPGAVVAIFVGNYATPALRNPNGALVADDSPEFFFLWQQRAEELSREVYESGATMYWVSPPPIVAPILRHAQRLFDGYRVKFLGTKRSMRAKYWPAPMDPKCSPRSRVVESNSSELLMRGYTSPMRVRASTDSK